MSKTIIILATGSSRVHCDFKADEIWGVNGSYTIENTMPKKFRKKFWMSKLFMADTLFSHEQGSLNFDIDAMNAFSEKHNCEMITLNPIRLGKHVLRAKRYPYDRIVRKFQTDYFTDTICYMIAYMLDKHTYLAQNKDGVVRLELKQPLNLRMFGVDMSTTREYQQSKGGVEYWLGMATVLGVRIENSVGSTILVHTSSGVPYGRWDLMRKNVRLYRKDIDPSGSMQGKNLTTAQQDRFWEKWDKEHEQRN